MGLFSFVKNAGAKLFGRKDKAKEAAEKAAAEAKENAEKAAAIKKAITNHGITIDYLRIVVEDDKVTLSGVAANAAEKEKAILIAGNVEGIASVDDQFELDIDEPTISRDVDVPKDLPTAPKGSTFYTVEKGDTLGKIAKAHYGNAMKYPVIFEANKPMLEHPDKIYPGQMLRIPAHDTA